MSHIAVERPKDTELVRMFTVVIKVLKELIQIDKKRLLCVYGKNQRRVREELQRLIRHNSTMRRRISWRLQRLKKKIAKK